MEGYAKWHLVWKLTSQGIQRTICFLNIFKAYVLKNKNQLYKLNII
jgi:hypothetical protein